MDKYIQTLKAHRSVTNCKNTSSVHLPYLRWMQNWLCLAWLGF